MKTIVLSLMLLTTSMMFLPGVEARPDPPTCVKEPCCPPWQPVCEIPDPTDYVEFAEFCFSLGFCIDPENPYGSAKAFVQWVKDQTGPCTCPPPNDPW